MPENDEIVWEETKIIHHPSLGGGGVGRQPIDDSIATRPSVDIKCINYFRFCRFTYEQDATLVREEIEKEGDELQKAL